ncbi:MAG: LamG domain-containing protein [Lentisphaerae bacterium]|nr:LamG domain-containing protein [Lentisphaerota bacterium]
MKKLLKTLILIVGLLESFNLGAIEGELGEGGENTPHPSWTLTPDAKLLLEKMRDEAKSYRPRTEKMGIFSRAQLKYGAERTDFIHNWYDRPLHQNSAWAETAIPRRIIHPEAWKKTVETVRLGKMDGLAVSISQSSRGEVIEQSVSPGGETQILVELPYGYHEKGVESFVKTAEKALAMPNSYRIDGKVVLTRYPAVGSAGVDYCEKVRKTLDERFGPDKFIVMFYVQPFPRRLSGVNLSASVLEEAREHLRRCLRKMDGIFMAGWDIYWPRRYNARFERDVLMPLYQSVLCEPEFAGRKYFGLNFTPGHENCYRWSYSLDSQGTHMLAERLKTIAQMRPDFIIGCEWDEQNENTCFRPMVAHGFVHQRIMRHFADVIAGRKPEPFPGDDTDTPNLVISYRRSLVAGEPIEVEVRNIPDGTFSGEDFEVTFGWLDAGGKLVKKYARGKLSADTMCNLWFVSPVTELVADNRFLRPALTVKTSSGKRFEYRDAFWPVDLNAVRCLDSKWVKHALREQPQDVDGSMKLLNRNADGECTIAGRFSSSVKVKSVEVLEGPDTVYMHDPEAPFNPDKVTIKLEIRARGSTPAKHRLNGTVRYLDAPGLEVVPVAATGRTTLADGWRLENVKYSNWGVVLFAEMPKASAATATIDVDLPPLFKKRMAVKDVLEKSAIGVSGVAGGNLIVAHYRSQRTIPHHLGVKSGEFSVVVKPSDPTGVLRLQIVDEKDRVWRGNAISLCRPSGRKRTVSIFERDEEVVSRLSVDETLVPEHGYSFDSSHGSIVWSEHGLQFCGIKGGGVSLVTGIGRGESCYGDSIAKYIDPKSPGAEHNAPESVVEPDGKKALEFRDCSYVMLPQQLISRFSGFEIELDVKPDDLGGVQTLVDSGNAAYTLLLRDGRVEFYLFNTVAYAKIKGAQTRVRGPKLKAGVWNRVKVSFDQRELVVSVDGTEGERVPVSCSQMQSRYTSVGAGNRNPNFFRGRLANLRFSPR